MGLFYFYFYFSRVPSDPPLCDDDDDSLFIGRQGS